MIHSKIVPTDGACSALYRQKEDGATCLLLRCVILRHAEQTQKAEAIALADLKHSLGIVARNTAPVYPSSMSLLV